MVFQHVQIRFAVGSGESSALGAVFLRLETAPAAPVRLLLASFVLLWLLLLRWLDGRLSWRALPRYLTSLSRNITAVYLIQWVLTGWLALGCGRLVAGWRDRRRTPAAVASESE